MDVPDISEKKISNKCTCSVTILDVFWLTKLDIKNWPQILQIFSFYEKELKFYPIEVISIPSAHAEALR